MANGDTKTNQYLDIAANGTRADLPSDTCCETRTQSLIRGVAERVMDVEDEVERLENNPDVVDIVATYADLQAYDTSTLTDKDVIRVLTDSTHNNNSTFYRWNATTSQFDYIGEVTSGPTVVQTTGTSTTNVMSQDATTKMVYATLGSGINIDAQSNWDDNIGFIALGKDTYLMDNYGEIAIGNFSVATGWNGSIALGYRAKDELGGVALGAYSEGNSVYAIDGDYGAVSVGSGGPQTFVNEFDETVTIPAFTRRITNVKDPHANTDAATKGYVDTAVAGASGGGVTFYMSVSPFVAASNVSLYSDADLTTAVPASALFQAFREGKNVCLSYKRVPGSAGYSEVVNVLTASVPNADTAEAYDEVLPAVVYFNSDLNRIIILQCVAGNPDSTNGFQIFPQ